MTIAAKIRDAQRSLSGIAKDATNTFHKYKYVSSEAMIADCRDALHKAGLSVICVGRTIKDGVLSSTFRLYDDAEHVDCTCDFPIVPDKGRPQDKAAAGAMTTSLSYFLRDLLLVPRQDEADINRRDDTNYEPNKGSRAKVLSALGSRIAEFSGTKPGTPEYTDAGKAVVAWLGYTRPLRDLGEMDLEHALNTLSERIAEGATFKDVQAVAAK